MTFEPEKMIFVWGADAQCRVRACPVNTFFCGFKAPPTGGFVLVLRCPHCGQEGKLSEDAKFRISKYNNILGVGEEE